MTEKRERPQWPLSVYLDEAGPSVQVQMKILYITVVGKLVPHVLLLRLLVNVRHKQNPAFHRCTSTMIEWVKVLSLTHIHTHSHCMALSTLSGTTWVSRQQKVHFAIFWSKMKIIQADAPTIRMDCHSSRLTGAPTSAIPNIFMQDALPYTTLPIYPGLGQAPYMLACILGGLVVLSFTPQKIGHFKDVIPNQPLVWYWQINLRTARLRVTLLSFCTSVVHNTAQIRVVVTGLKVKDGPVRTHFVTEKE